MEHRDSVVKGGKTVITTSLAGLIAFYTLPYVGYANTPLDPVVYASATAFVAGAIKYCRDLANQVLHQAGWDIVL